MMGPDMETLSSFVGAAQHGDLEAFGCIVERFQAMARAMAYVMVDDSQLAEDVAQEAFVEAFLNLPKLREPAAFPGWFRRIVFKQGDRLTRGKHVMTMPLESLPDVPLAGLDPALVIEGREMDEAVHQAVEGLPEHERMVVILFYGTGYALKEIAAFLEVPVTTVKKRLHDARGRLKGELIDTVRSSLHNYSLAGGAGFPDQVRLLIAARTGDIDGVKTLLNEKPALINMRAERGDHLSRYYTRRSFGYTALHEAAGNGHVALVNMLLDYGANVNARTRNGITPLHEAVMHHETRAVKLLLAGGANADVVYANGHSPLHWAVIRGYEDIARLLLAGRAAVNARSRAGRTALHWAAIKDRREIAQLLLDYGADMHARDELGRTAEDWAKEKKGRDALAPELSFAREREMQ